MNSLQSVNHVLDRLAHTMRIMGAVEIPADATTPMQPSPPFELGLSAALRAIRIEQQTAEIFYGAYVKDGAA